MGTFFQKIQDVPMDYLIRTLQSHYWEHSDVLGIFCAGNTAIKLAWKILNVFVMYQTGFWWVHCPFPCDVFAVS